MDKLIKSRWYYCRDMAMLFYQSNLLLG